MEGTHYTSGVKSILVNHRSIRVYCDDDGFTTIQSRGQFGNPEDYFFRNWDAYLQQFGTAGKEFWLGLQNIYELTNHKAYSLKIEAEDQDGDRNESTWNEFKLTEDVRKV